jgi:hypothetical protein
MNSGRKFQRRQCRREHINQSQGRMIGHEVPAAFLAILPLANLGLLKHSDMLGSRSYPHGFGLPKTKGVHRAARPRATRTAMAVAHGFRLTGNFQMNCPAKTFACARSRHCLLPRLFRPMLPRPEATDKAVNSNGALLRRWRLNVRRQRRWVGQTGLVNLGFQINCFFDQSRCNGRVRGLIWRT